MESGVHVENFSQKKRQEFRWQFPLVLTGVQKHYKKRLAKRHRVEKFLQKNRQKIQNRFFVDLF
jgi:hypothetical protein